MSIRGESEYFVITDEIAKDVINRLQAENKQLRDKLTTVAGRLNALRADVESTLWPNSGFARVDEVPK